MRCYCDTRAHARPVLPDMMACAAGHTPKFRLPDTAASTSWGYFRSNCADHMPQARECAWVHYPTPPTKPQEPQP